MKVTDRLFFTTSPTMVIIIARKMGIPHMMMTNSRKFRSTYNSSGLIILIYNPNHLLLTENVYVSRCAYFRHVVASR